MKTVCALTLGVLVLACSTRAASHRELTASEMAMLRGGANGKCAGFKDCGTKCVYDEPSNKCSGCVAPTGGTTQYSACVAGTATDNCEEDSANTGDCGAMSTNNTAFAGEDPCIYKGKSVCLPGKSDPACMSYYKLKSGQTVCASP